MASLERKSDVILEILRYYTDEEGWPLMYLVRQCYCDYYLSYIAKKGMIELRKSFNLKVATENTILMGHIERKEL